MDFTLYDDCSEFHSEFQSLEVTRHKPMTDKMAFHFFELSKLPESIDKNDLLLLWLALFNANTEEELKEIEALEVPDLIEAISAYHNVTASPEFHELERLRAKARHDEAQALHNAELKGELKGEKTKAIVIAKNMLADGEPVERIMKYTGLTCEEVGGVFNAE